MVAQLTECGLLVRVQGGVEPDIDGRRSRGSLADLQAAARFSCQTRRGLAQAPRQQ